MNRIGTWEWIFGESHFSGMGISPWTNAQDNSHLWL